MGGSSVALRQVSRAAAPLCMAVLAWSAQPAQAGVTSPVPGGTYAISPGQSTIAIPLDWSYGLPDTRCMDGDRPGYAHVDVYLAEGGGTGGDQTGPYSHGSVVNVSSPGTYTGSATWTCIIDGEPTGHPLGDYVVSNQALETFSFAVIGLNRDQALVRRNVVDLVGKQTALWDRWGRARTAKQKEKTIDAQVRLGQRGKGVLRDWKAAGLPTQRSNPADQYRAPLAEQYRYLKALAQTTRNVAQVLLRHGEGDCIAFAGAVGYRGLLAPRPRASVC